MEKNSFKKLEKLEMDQLQDSADRVRVNVNHTMGTFRFAGDVVQLFLPKIFEALLALFGAPGSRETGKNSKYPNLRG